MMCMRASFLSLQSQELYGLEICYHVIIWYNLFLFLKISMQEKKTPLKHIFESSNASLEANTIFERETKQQSSGSLQVWSSRLRRTAPTILVPSPIESNSDSVVTWPSMRELLRFACPNLSELDERTTDGRVPVVEVVKVNCVSSVVDIKISVISWKSEYDKKNEFMKCSRIIHPQNSVSWSASLISVVCEVGGMARVALMCLALL